MARSSANPLRWITPSQFVICLVLFFLPWVEIQCPMPKGGLNFNVGAPPQAGPPEFIWTGFVQQSGLQAATGGYSFVDPTLQKMYEAEKRNPTDKNAKADAKKDDPPPAPLLWLYLLAVIAGIAIGFAMPPGYVRKGALIGCCVLALVSAGGQAVIGFPIQTKIEEELKEDKGGGANLKLDSDMRPKTRLKIPFFLAVLFSLGALVTTLIEPMGTKPKSRRPRDEEELEEGEPYDPGF
jgi:hypothetical protein